MHTGDRRRKQGRQPEKKKRVSFRLAPSVTCVVICMSRAFRKKLKRDCLLLDSKAHDSWPVRLGLYPRFFISQLISYSDFWWTKSNPSITDKLERAPQITRDGAKDSHKIFERHIYDNLLYGLRLVFEKKHSTETALIRQKLRVWSRVRWL